MTLDIPTHAANRLAAVEELLADLEALGLVTAKDATTAQAAIDRAHNAKHLSRLYDQKVVDDAMELGTTIAADYLHLDEVFAKATAIPDAKPVNAILAAVWRTNVEQARDLVFARVSEAPQVLTERFADITAQAQTTATALGHVDTPQDALDLGLAEEWQQFAELRRAYASLAETREALRKHKLIAAPRTPGEGGWHWNTRYPLADGALKVAVDKAKVDGGRAVFALYVAAEPYCPSSEAEAQNVLAAEAKVPAA